ncbi:hypothetical protein CBR_g48339 [Chara braunii]|uniref:Uncharacterized protein n=1 Tax=Chara braunii TaxID=69332 RepID=A0A388K4A0_CHABU|nr:hypothetical protein CBR_g48339 [Chara braunii]|eukprot:GBG64871.1 hypothetical protein CBR_g48339 [Chara braunii]
MIGFVVVAQKKTDRHLFPSSAMAMGDSLAYSNGHGASPGVQTDYYHGNRPAGDRSLASEDVLPSVTLLEQELFVRDVNGTAGTPRAVLVHTPEAPFNAIPSPFDESSGLGYRCESIYRNVVFLPNSTQFFAILEQSCITRNRTYQRNLEASESVGISYVSLTFREMSVRHADLLPMRQGSKPLADEAVLSYWWPVDSTDGERVSSPILYEKDKNMPIMATIYGMDIAETGTHLVLVSFRHSGSMQPTPPVLMSLSTINGSRSLIMSLTGDVTSVDGIAFDRNKTKLFATENFLSPSSLLTGGRLWVRLASADVDESGYPVTSDGRDRERDPFHIVHRLGSPPDPEIDYVPGGAYFSPHSVTPSGRCMYLMNKYPMEVFGVDPSTSELTRVLGPGMKTKPFAFSHSRTPYTARTDIAATSDGCNLFITGAVDYPASTGLVWVKMTRRCGRARSKEVVARYDGYETTGIGSLALQELEGRLFLYIGATDGRLFELEINRSHLHVCSDASRRLRPPPLSLLITFLHLLTFVMAFVSFVIAL